MSHCQQDIPKKSPFEEAYKEKFGSYPDLTKIANNTKPKPKPKPKRIVTAESLRGWLTNSDKHFSDYLRKNGITALPGNVYDACRGYFSRLVSSRVAQQFGISGFDPPKGLYIYGGTGCGKTTIARLLVGAIRRYNVRYPIFVARRMAEDYASYPDYTQTLRRDTEKQDVAIDDLGTERIVNRYGVAWGFEDYLDDRYRSFIEFGMTTMITTNIKDEDEFVKRYGERIYSRLQEMCDVVLYAHPDRRIAMSVHL